MALIKCPDCQVEMSDAAASCSRCGRVRELSPLYQIVKGVFFLFNAVMAVWLIGELLLGMPSRVMVPWATGSVILGMLALVTKGPTKDVHYWRDRTKRGDKGEDPVVSRAIERRHARGEVILGTPEQRERRQDSAGPPSESDAQGRNQECEPPSSRS